MQDLHDSTLYDYINSTEIARGYDKYHSANRLFDLDRRFIEEVLPPRGTVLDIGCGTGRLLVYLQEKGYRAIGVDLSRHMLEVAREKLGDKAPLVRADMLALPIAEGQVDACIMMFSVLGMLKGEYLRKLALKEAARVLRRGGILALHVHNRYKHVVRGAAGLLKGFVFSLLGRNAEIMRNYRSLPALYLHLFSRREILRLLEETGFAIARDEAIAPDRKGFITGLGRSWAADGFFVSAVKRG
jgi:ubiquinone/menaquinone biosynthesis C-methylase UbiE